MMLPSDLIYDFLITLSKRLTEIDVSVILTTLQCKLLQTLIFVFSICSIFFFRLL